MGDTAVFLGYLFLTEMGKSYILNSFLRWKMLNFRNGTLESALALIPNWSKSFKSKWSEKNLLANLYGQQFDFLRQHS